MPVIKDHVSYQAVFKIRIHNVFEVHVLEQIKTLLQAFSTILL